LRNFREWKTELEGGAVKKTQAFTEVRGKRVVFVVLSDELLSSYFCVQIEVGDGAYRKHPVSLHLTLKDAMNRAEEFLASDEDGASISDQEGEQNDET
jgi:hypothetical protein